MNLSSIVPAAKFAVGRTSLVLSKHAPDILVGSGIVGFIATAVTASKATLTLGDILDKDREDLDRIHESSNDERYAEVYTKKDINIFFSRLRELAYSGRGISPESASDSAVREMNFIR